MFPGGLNAQGVYLWLPTPGSTDVWSSPHVWAREGTAQQSRSRTAAYTVAGALVGGSLRMITFLVQADEECRSGESMCGLLIPAFVVPPAVVGGVVGYILGRRR